MEQVLDQEQLYKSISKIKMYKEEQDLTLENISETFKKLNYLYLTGNSEDLKNKMFSIQNNNSNVMKNNNSNIFVLEKNISKYSDLSDLSNRIFNSIE